MYRLIVVPLDGSKFAEAALPLALTLSRRTGSALHFVTVLEPIPSYAYEEWESAAREWSEEYLQDLAKRVSGHADGEVTTALLTGHVVEMLDEETKARNGDLVIMATHGRGTLSRVWLGSVADGFLHDSDRPVILVRPEEGEPPPADQEHRFQTVLVPLDGSQLSECALTHAIEFGELFGAAYHLTRVVTYPLDIASPYLPHTVQMNQTIVDDARAGSADYLEGHADRMRTRGMRVTTSVVVDSQAGHGILTETEAVGCDLVAMATHARAGLSRAILGSATDKVLRGTHVPLLLYRPCL